jgi:predicted nucleic acid-binding protein
VKIIVDTNIVFSALLNTNSRIAQILIYAQPNFQFYSCDYLNTEILRHQKKILKLTKLTIPELYELQNFVTHNITFINEGLLPQELIENTQNILQEIDPFDVPFVALAKHLNAKLWTGDLRLINGLKAKQFNDVISTAELAKIFEDFEQ